MNDDHADALAMMVGAYLDVQGARIGLEPAGDAAPGVAFGRIGFARALDGPDQARAAMVELTKAARG